MELSKRLAAVAALVDAGSRPADIGTDHAYIPIWLVEEGICQKAFAMDVGKGPLERAREHITGHGLGNYIETRLSDGLGALAPGEADCCLLYTSAFLTAAGIRKYWQNALKKSQMSIR